MKYHGSSELRTFYKKENKLSSGNCSIMIDGNVKMVYYKLPGLAKKNM